MAIINLFSKKRRLGEGFIKIDKTALTIYGLNNRGTITVVRKLGNGSIMASSSDTRICSVSISDNVITVRPRGTDGVATITIYSTPGTWHGMSNICTCECTIYNFSDATAQPSDIKEGLQLYTRDGLITGTMPVINGGNAGASYSNIILPAGSYLASDYVIPGITTSFVSSSTASGVYITTSDRSGHTVENIGPGTYSNSSTLSGVNAVTSSSMAKGYSAYINGNKISGSLIKDANVVVNDKTFSMDEGSSVTITPYVFTGNCHYDNGSYSSSYINGRVRIRDGSTDALIQELSTPNVTFTYSRSGNTYTISAVCNGSTLTTITVTV